MNKMEKAALEHVAEYHRYARSAQAAIDLKADIAKRRALDRKMGVEPGQGWSTKMLGDANPFRKRK